MQNKNNSRPNSDRKDSGDRRESKPFSSNSSRGARRDDARPTSNSSSRSSAYPRATSNSRDERPARRFDDAKPNFNRDDRKPFGNRDERPARRFDDAKPNFNRDDRKPFGNRDERPARRFDDAKPSFNRDDRKPFGNRDERPARRFDDAKPSFNRDDRKPFGNRDERPRKLSGEERDKNRDRRPDSRLPQYKPNEVPKAFGKGGRKADDDTKPRVRIQNEDKKIDHSRRVDTGGKPFYEEEKIIKSLPGRILDKVRQEEKEDDGLIRLNRYISNAGLCSRREADELIASGQISVNGKVITELGFKVQPTDNVSYGRKVLNKEKMVYLLLNKPKDFITTTEDPKDRHTVMDLVGNACKERIYPVGRLDRNTTGLLLLTNDGELAEKLSHPANNIKKIYQAELDKPITSEHFEMIQAGLELEDGFIKPDNLGIVTPDAFVVGIEIHSGKNRIVRRIFEHLGYEVTKLDRTTYAGLTKKDLPRGKWRFLTEKEVIRLKYML